MNIFQIHIGDYGRDGHNQFDVVTFSSNKSFVDVEKAYEKAETLVDSDLWPSNLCSEYEERKFPVELIPQLVQTYPFLKEWNIETDEDPDYYIGSDDFAQLVVEFIKLGDPELEITELKIPRLNDQFGYGLFY